MVGMNRARFVFLLRPHTMMRGSCVCLSGVLGCEWCFRVVFFFLLRSWALRETTFCAARSVRAIACPGETVLPC